MTTCLLTGLASTQNACSERARRSKFSSRSAEIRMVGLKPGKTGKVHVHERNMDLMVLDDVDGLLATLGEESTKALRLEDIAKRLTGIRVIVSDQYRVALDRKHGNRTHTWSITSATRVSFLVSEAILPRLSRPLESRISH